MSRHVMIRVASMVRICFIACLFVPSWKVSCTYGQTMDKIEIPSTLNPVGSGARALGMGGAFIAVADDATAASWNPGGLIQLERPEFSVVGEAFHRTEDLSFGRQKGGEGEQSVAGIGLNYLSGAYPFVLLDRNMIVSLSYQHLFDFTRTWKQSFYDGRSKTKRDYEQDGGLYALGLAYCVQILPELSFGFTLNLWDDFLYENGWDQTLVDKRLTRDAVGNLRRSSLFRHDSYSLTGFNANVGVLWAVNGKLSVGAVFKTPFTADLEHEFNSTNRIAPFPPQKESLTRDEELDMPMSYGLGLAYRFSDRLSVSADVYRTEWGDFVLKRPGKGGDVSPVSGLPVSRSDVEATTQVRLGSEYLFIKPKYVVPVRGGFFYDPAPAEGGPDNYFGFSLGSGIGIDRFVFDIAYQYRFGMDVGTSILRHLRFSEDVHEHTVFSSLIVHF